MARRAVIESCVIKVNVGPLLGVGMAVGAGSRGLLHRKEARRLTTRPFALPGRIPHKAICPDIVPTGAIRDMAGAAFVDVGMLECQGLPIIGAVA